MLGRSTRLAKSKKGDTSKTKSNKSKDKKDKSKSKDKKSSKSKDSKKKSEKSKDKKSKKEEEPKVQDEKDIQEIINNEEKEKIEKANLIQNLSGNNPQLLTAFQNNMTHYQEKCEGCFQGDGIVFCTECGKIYCKTCDDQLHVIPSYRNHERIPLEAFSETKMQCYHHNQPLRLFCETCHEPICTKCQKMGPHNTPLHNIASLFQVYKKFLDIGKNYINGPLKEKAGRIEDLILQVDNALNDSKSKAKELLHSISIKYESVIEKIIKLD